MQKLIRLILIYTFTYVHLNTFAQNVGIGAMDPQAKLDINGDVVFRTADITIADSLTLALDVITNKFSSYRLWISGPYDPFILAGITAGVDGRMVTLFNRNSNTPIQLNNEDEAAAPGDGIRTGTNENLILNAGGMITLQYDSSVQRWIAHNIQASGEGQWNLSITDLYNLNAGNVGIGTLTPESKLHVAGNIKVDTLNPDAIRMTTNAGEGKVLTSDDTGLASWQPPPPPPPPGPPTYYPSVTICCQSWMTKNLDVSIYRNGDVIPEVTDNAEWTALTTGAYCYFNNDSTTYAATYGKLYNWYAVNDSRGLAPEGWHIPSQFEWTTLGSCLGGNGVAGGPMKEIGTTHWTSPNTGATNLSNFTGLPGGFRIFYGPWFNIGNYGYWWSSTEISASDIWVSSLNNTIDDLVNSIDDKRFGLSVRCLRD